MTFFAVDTSLKMKLKLLRLSCLWNLAFPDKGMPIKIVIKIISVVSLINRAQTRELQRIGGEAELLAYAEEGIIVDSYFISLAPIRGFERIVKGKPHIRD